MNYELWFWLLIVVSAASLLWAAQCQWKVGAFRYCIKVLKKSLGFLQSRAGEMSGAIWLEHTVRKYEELRKLIDGGSESMTHEDAVEVVKWNEKRSDWYYELNDLLDTDEDAKKAGGKLHFEECIERIKRLQKLDERENER